MDFGGLLGAATTSRRAGWRLSLPARSRMAPSGPGNWERGSRLEALGRVMRKRMVLQCQCASKTSSLFSPPLSSSTWALPSSSAELCICGCGGGGTG